MDVADAAAEVGGRRHATPVLAGEGRTNDGGHGREAEEDVAEDVVARAEMCVSIDFVVDCECGSGAHRFGPRRALKPLIHQIRVI